MPTLRVNEGDLKIFLARVDKLEARIVELSDIMAMVVQMQRDMQREMQSLFTSHPTFIQLSLTFTTYETRECDQQCQRNQQC
jgi:hypothetical protein